MKKTNDFGLNILVANLIKSLDEGFIPWDRAWCITKNYVSRATGDGYSWLNCIPLKSCGEFVSRTWCIKNNVSFAGTKDMWEQVYGVFSAYKMAKDKDGNDIKVFKGQYIRVYKVINVKYLGLEPKYFGKDKVNKTVSPTDRNNEIETVIQSYCQRGGVKIFEKEEENKAFYRPATDSINIKRRDYFKSLDAFYGVLFHEMIHSTGHKNRFNRFDQFADHDYDREELVAEIGSAMLRNYFGISSDALDRDTKAYIQSWTRALSDKPEMIKWAAGKAEKAAKYVLGIFDMKSESETEKVA